MAQGSREDENFMETKGRKTEDTPEIMRQREVKKFQKRVKKGGRALNIALIGACGSGKSSFCNSVMTAFCGKEWREWVMVGYHGGFAEQFTQHLLR